MIGGFALSIPACSKAVTTSDEAKDRDNVKELGLGAHKMFDQTKMRVQVAAARAQSQNNLKQMGIGIHSIASTYNGRLPPANGAYPKNGPSATVFFHLLPYIEADNIYRQHVMNPQAIPPTTMVKIYCSPCDLSNPGNLALCSYAANEQVFGSTDGGSAVLPASFINKGTSNTIMFFEHYAQPASADGAPAVTNYWYSPSTALYAPAQGPMPWTTVKNPQFDVPPTQTAPAPDNTTAHAFITNSLTVGLGDGSVRTVSKTVTSRLRGWQGDATIWQWTCCVQGELSSAIGPNDW
jgi:hypothetical protein